MESEKETNERTNDKKSDSIKVAVKNRADHEVNLFRCWLSLFLTQEYLIFDVLIEKKV